MSLNFIVGPAGSGKTRYIVDSVVHMLAAEGFAESENSRSIILLVPDQATFQTEREILRDPRINGFLRLHVLSFRRLCYRVMEEAGGLFYPFLTAVGKSMAIQSALWESRDYLTVFAPLVNHPGFRESLSRAFSEFSAYDISPCEIQGRLGQGKAGVGQGEIPFLPQKVHDLDVLYSAYQEFLKGRFLDPEDYLKIASERMRGSSLVRGASVWVDGFSGFTPGEYKVLGRLMQFSEDVNVALCMDKQEVESPISETSLFHPVRLTYDKLKQTAYEAGVASANLFLKDGSPLPRFRDSPELAHLEAALRFRMRGRRQGIPQPPTGGENRVRPDVRLLAAVNPLAEIEFAAREITRLVRDGGLRYRDITVEARDLGVYADIIPLVFGDFGIPYFLDQRKPLSFHPLAELLRASLDAVTTSFRSEAVFRYLKTDLVPVGRDQVDRLENYVLAHGITGETWISAEPWRYVRRYFSDEETSRTEEEEAAYVDSVRRDAVRELSRFYMRLDNKEDLTARDLSLAVYELLMDLQVPKTLERWQEAAEGQGDLAAAMVHSGLWDKVIELLEQAGQILGDRVCQVKTYAMLLDAGLEDIRLGVIPPSLDQVMVGNLDRSRQPACKITFLVGAGAGIFPKKHSEDSIFCDREREYLAGHGVDLEPGSHIRQIHEQYLIYIALTRPEKALYISYPLCDTEGRAVSPSYVVGMVSEILGGREAETVLLDPPGRLPEDLDFVVGARVLGTTVRRLALVRHGVWPGEVWVEAYRWLLSPDRLSATCRVLSALGFTNAMVPLNEEIVRGLYGNKLVTSVSRLERFGACPFYHFASDGLGLREREAFELEPAGAGTFLHSALKGVVSSVMEAGTPWGSLSDEQVLILADNAVNSLLSGPDGDIFASSARLNYVADALRRITRRSALVLTEHARRGRFSPVAVEVTFGPGASLPPLRLKLPGGQEVLIRGQIDRVDAALSEGSLFLRVIDYKSSPQTLDPADVYHGLSLQLMVYLMAAMEFWRQILKVEGAPPGPRSGLPDAVVPAGALYFAARDPVASARGPESPGSSGSAGEELAGLLRGMKMTGLLNADPTVLRLMDSGSSGHSDIIPVQFTLSGVGKNSQAASLEDLKALLEFVDRKVREFCSSIFAGNLDVAPYRKGTRRACTYCPYGSLCTFDILVPGNRYRSVSPIEKAHVWSLIREG